MLTYKFFPYPPDGVQLFKSLTPVTKVATNRSRSKLQIDLFSILKDNILNFDGLKLFSFIDLFDTSICGLDLSRSICSLDLDLFAAHIYIDLPLRSTRENRPQ